MPHPLIQNILYYVHNPVALGLTMPTLQIVRSRFLALKLFVSPGISGQYDGRTMSVFYRLPTEGYTQGGKFW
jgi:hypothetical protein